MSLFSSTSNAVYRTHPRFRNNRIDPGFKLKFKEAFLSKLCGIIISMMRTLLDSSCYI